MKTNKITKRIYYSYVYWEDYINGMYDLNKINEYELKQLGINLLIDLVKFEKIALEVTEKWPISTSVNLTNDNCNQKAWLGQAACCYLHKIPEYITRLSWSELTEKQRTDANNIALLVIHKYNIKNEKNYNQLCLFLD
jgi:hypothetical protein